VRHCKAPIFTYEKKKRFFDVLLSAKMRHLEHFKEGDVKATRRRSGSFVDYKVFYLFRKMALVKANPTRARILTEVEWYFYT
jgi:hypothetical protein